MSRRPRITEQERTDFIYGPISPTQIREDVVKALDETWELRLDRESCQNWLKLFGVVISVEGALIAWLATHLFDCLEAAHRLTAAVQ